MHEYYILDGSDRMKEKERTRAYYRYARRNAIFRRRKKLTKWFGYKKGYEICPVDGKLAKESIQFSQNKQKPRKRGTQRMKASDKRQLLRARDAVDEGLIPPF